MVELVKRRALPVDVIGRWALLFWRVEKESDGEETGRGLGS
jgi:hypothetical protein